MLLSRRLVLFLSTVFNNLVPRMALFLSLVVQVLSLVVQVLSLVVQVLSLVVQVLSPVVQVLSLNKEGMGSFPSRIMEVFTTTIEVEVDLEAVFTFIIIVVHTIMFHHFMVAIQTMFTFLVEVA